MQGNTIRDKNLPFHTFKLVTCLVTIYRVFRFSLYFLIIKITPLVAFQTWRMQKIAHRPQHRPRQVTSTDGVWYDNQGASRAPRFPSRACRRETWRKRGRPRAPPPSLLQTFSRCSKTAAQLWIQPPAATPSRHPLLSFWS